MGVCPIGLAWADLVSDPGAAVAAAGAALAAGDTNRARALALRVSRQGDGVLGSIARQLLKRLPPSGGRTASPARGAERPNEAVALSWADGCLRLVWPCRADAPRVVIEVDGDFRVLAPPAQTGGQPAVVTLRLPGEARVLRVAVDGLAFANNPLVLRHDPAPCPPASVSAVGCDVAEVCVVIPLYRAVASIASCLQSLIGAVCLTRWQAVLVDDASEDHALGAVLAPFLADPRFSLLRRPINGGFAAAVNTALRRLGARDVVLLNSDTLVSDGWLDRLHRAAHAASDIGAVNPLSNHAELLSLPVAMMDNAMPQGECLARINRSLGGESRACTEGAAGRPTLIDLPAGVGFCWYIKGEALDSVGLLDEAWVRRGYGEDTEFSIRLHRAGWRTVAATDVYVAHRGSQSFGAGKGPLAKLNNAVLRLRFPDHAAHYQHFLSQWPLEALAESLQRDLLRQGMARGETLHRLDARAWRRRCLLGPQAPAWALVPVRKEGRRWGYQLLAHMVPGFSGLRYPGPRASERLRADLREAGFARIARTIGAGPAADAAQVGAQAPSARRQGDFRRIALLDLSHPSQGFHLVEGLARAWHRHADPRRLVVWGTTLDDRRLARFASVEMPGSLGKDLGAALAELGCDAVACAAMVPDGLDAAFARRTGLPFIGREGLQAWFDQAAKAAA